MLRLFFLLAILAPHVARAGATRTSRPSGQSAPCQAPLTLTLQPGLEYPKGNVVIRPAPDIPSGPVVIQVPLYSGAVSSTQPVPIFSYSDTPYLKTATAVYLLPIDDGTADEWYQSQFAACGYKAQGSGYSSNGTSERDFVSSTNPYLEVEVVYQPMPSGGTAILYVAMDTTLPPRPADSYLPNDVVRLTISDMTDSEKRLHLVVRNHSMVRALVTAINALSDVDAGVHSCAPVDGQASVTFARRDGAAVHVEATCRQVVIGTTRPLVDTNLAVWNTIQLFVKRCPQPLGAFVNRGC